MQIDLRQGSYFISFENMRQMRLAGRLRVRRVHRENGEDNHCSEKSAEVALQPAVSPRKDVEGPGRTGEDTDQEVSSPLASPSPQCQNPCATFSPDQEVDQVSCPKVVWLGDLYSYHMTCKQAAASILRSQTFLPSRRGLLGPFIYFAASCEDCQGKARQATLEGVILRSLVSCGRCLLVDAPSSKHTQRILSIKSWSDITKEKLKQLGCTSIYATSPLVRRDEWAVPSMGQVSEVRIVQYRRLTADGMTTWPFWKWPAWAHSVAVAVGTDDVAIDQASAVKEVISRYGVRVDASGRPVDHDGNALSYAEARRCGWGRRRGQKTPRQSERSEIRRASSWTSREEGHARTSSSGNRSSFGNRSSSGNRSVGRLGHQASTAWDVLMKLQAFMSDVRQSREGRAKHRASGLCGRTAPCILKS